METDENYLRPNVQSVNVRINVSPVNQYHVVNTMDQNWLKQNQSTWKWKSIELFPTEEESGMLVVVIPPIQQN